MRPVQGYAHGAEYAVPAHVDAVWGRVPRLISYGLLSYYEDPEPDAEAAARAEGGAAAEGGLVGSRARFVDNGSAGIVDQQFQHRHEI